MKRPTGVTGLNWMDCSHTAIKRGLHVWLLEGRLFGIWFQEKNHSPKSQSHPTLGGLGVIVAWGTTASGVSFHYFCVWFFFRHTQLYPIKNQVIISWSVSHECWLDKKTHETSIGSGFSTLDPHSRKFRNAEKLGSFHPAPPSCELGVAAPNLGKAGVHNHAACGLTGVGLFWPTLFFFLDFIFSPKMVDQKSALGTLK